MIKLNKSFWYLKMIDIALIKEHLQIYNNYDDNKIIQYRDGAILAIQQKIDRKIYASQADLDNADDADGVVITNDIIQAVLMIVGAWFSNRSGLDNTKEIPMGVHDLIFPYRKLGI